MEVCNNRTYKKNLIAQSRIIAKGERIRDVQHLVNKYGVKPSKWVNKSSS